MNFSRNEADEKAIRNGCYFDERSADKVAEFFRRFLRHSKGQWAGKPFELLPWQREITDPLFGWKRPDGTRRFRKAYIELPKKQGKALALDTPIPTPSGWTTIGELQTGDPVFDDNGLPCRVVATTEIQHGRPCYEVEFSDGCTIVADTEHEWLTRTRKPEGKTQHWTTRQIAETLRIESPGSAGSNHSIPVAAPLALDSVDLPIPPYVLGAWLGDGTSAIANITCADEPIVNEIAACGVLVRLRGSTTKAAKRYHLGHKGNSRAQRDQSLQATLRKAGLLNNKHIPAAYLRASYSQRIALLQGLMDTDGYCSKVGQCVFTTTSAALRDGAFELLCSLGFKPMLCEGRAKIYGRDCGPKYDIHFYAYDDCPAFRLPRKLARQKKKPNRIARSTNRHIVAVRPIPSVPVRCIQVDSPSRLYLAGRSMIPTHNSTIAAGIGLYMLVADNEPGAECYSAATDQKQASIVHGEACNMVDASPELSSRLAINRTTKTISLPSTQSVYRALSAGPRGQEGLNAHCIIVDELHAWYGRQLWDALKYAFRSRRQGLLFVITTAGDDMQSVCREQHDYAQGVINGTIADERYFAYIRAAEPTDDWTDPKVWRKANPSLGVTIDEAEFAADVEEAKKSPTTQASFKRYSLNIWATATNAWLRMEDWQANREDYTADDLLGQDCFAGIDLAATQDMTACVLLFRNPYRLLPYFWLPEDTVNSPDSPEEYRVWAKAGILRTTPGNACDYAFVERDIAELAARYKIREIAYDPWGSASEQVTQRLEQSTGVPRVAFPQTLKNFAGPTAEFERLLLRREMHHAGHPILTWQAGHVSVYSDPNGNMRPVKPKHGDRRKIDGITGAIMALARDLANPEHTSVYETRGVLAF